MLESEDSEEISEELETTATESEPTTTESETKTAKRKNLRENLTLKLSLQFYFEFEAVQFLVSSFGFQLVRTTTRKFED